MAPQGTEFTQQLQVADSMCAVSSTASQANTERFKEHCKAFFLGTRESNIEEVTEFNVSPDVMSLVRRNYKAKAF